MKTELRHSGSEIHFVLAGVDPALRSSVIDLAFREVDGDFVRSFPAEAEFVDRAYAGFAAHIDEMVLQTAGVRPTPWDRALEELLERTAGSGVELWLAGSAALAARGLDVAPRDLDVIVDDDGARQLAELLADVLVDPLSPVTGWICNWWGRAFLHARVEWVGGVGPQVDEPAVADFGPTAARSLETIEWRGRALRVPPLGLQLEVCERRGLVDRAAAIRGLLG